MSVVKLLDGVTANANSDGVNLGSAGQAVHATMTVTSTDFGSGSVALEVSHDGGTTWVVCGTLTALSAIGSSSGTFVAGLARLALSGATSPDAVHGWLAWQKA